MLGARRAHDPHRHGALPHQMHDTARELRYRPVLDLAAAHDHQIVVVLQHVPDHFDERLTDQHLDLRAVTGSGVLREQAQPFGPMPQQLGVNVDGPAPHRREPPHPSHGLHDVEHGQPGLVRLRQLDRSAQHLGLEVSG